MNTMGAQRSAGYLIGVCVLPIGTLGFLAGFASPYWHFSREGDGRTWVHGLWVTCQQDSGTVTECEDNVVLAEDWLRGVQFLESAALLLLLLSCLMAVLDSFTPTHNVRRLLEFSAGFGAVFAVFGSLGYLLFTLSPPNQDDPFTFLTFTWGFGINVTGAVLSALAAILIAVFHKPPVGKKADNSRGLPASKAKTSVRSGTSSKGEPYGQSMKSVGREMGMLSPEKYRLSRV